MAKTNPERFRLQVVGADEDVPRMLLAYGRGCGGEVAFVMRPRENTALLVHQMKKQPARIWKDATGAAPTMAPSTEMAAAEALAEIRRAKASPPPAGPATLRGTWSGKLMCDDGKPSVALERRVASYGVLKLVSDASGGWIATFERAGKWFTSAKQESVTRANLAEAITAGMGLVVGLVSEACSYRDTHRRNAVDAEYAERFPLRAPREMRDPTERYQPRAAFRAVEATDGWHVLNEVGAVVARFGAREKGKATRFAASLGRGEQVDTQSVSSSPTVSVTPDIADAFGMRGLPGVQVAPALADVPTPAPPANAQALVREATAAEMQADALVELAKSSWSAADAPALLARAAKLIRYAESLVRSPRCTGNEQRMAWEDLQRAADAYTQARDAMGRGETPDVLATLRRIAERVSLAAARAAKACAGGQQRIGPAPRSADDIVRSVTASETPIAPPATMAPTTPAASPEKPKRGRKPKAPAVDPAKDAALIDAFADAIKQAAAQMGGGAS